MKRFKSYSLNRQTHRRTDRRTDRQTDRQTDTTENITYPHSRVVNIQTQRVLIRRVLLNKTVNFYQNKLNVLKIFNHDEQATCTCVHCGGFRLLIIKHSLSYYLILLILTSIGETWNYGRYPAC